MKIVILEDNKERQAAMKACLADRFYQHQAVFLDSANDTRRFLEANLAEVLLICLDHDLELQVQEDGKLADPGTGREVADFLAQQAPACPIVIHTTNSVAGDGMEFLLREARWDVSRVHPFGDLEWVSTAWFRKVRDAIVRSARVQTNALA